MDEQVEKMAESTMRSLVEMGRRDRIATAAMQALIGVSDKDASAKDLAVNACYCADALIAELDKAQLEAARHEEKTRLMGGIL